MNRTLHCEVLIVAVWWITFCLSSQFSRLVSSARSSWRLARTCWSASCWLSFPCSTSRPLNCRLRSCRSRRQSSRAFSTSRRLALSSLTSLSTPAFCSSNTAAAANTFPSRRVHRCIVYYYWLLSVHAHLVYYCLSYSLYSMFYKCLYRYVVH